MSRVSATFKRALSFRAIEPAAERVVEVPKISEQVETGLYSAQWTPHRLWRISLRCTKLSFRNGLWKMTVHRLRSRVGDVPQQRDGRTRAQIGVIKAPETASQDRRLQRTVERSSGRKCEQIGVIEVSMNSSQENFETVKCRRLQTVGVVGVSPA